MALLVYGEIQEKEQVFCSEAEAGTEGQIPACLCCVRKILAVGRLAEWIVTYFLRIHPQGLRNILNRDVCTGCSHGRSSRVR